MRTLVTWLCALTLGCSQSTLACRPGHLLPPIGKRRSVSQRWDPADAIRSHPQRWTAELDDHPAERVYNVLHYILQDEGYARFFRSLGLERIAPMTVALAPSHIANNKLASRGVGFKLAPVDGHIAMGPWVDLTIDGYYVVGDPHDVITHFGGIALLDKEITDAYRGQLRMLRAMQTELAAPAPVIEALKARLNSRGRAFEIESYRLSEVVASIPSRDIVLKKEPFVMVVRSFLDLPREGSVGAAAELAEWKAKITEAPEAWGFRDLRQAERFCRRMDELFTRLRANDPNLLMDVSVTERELPAIVERGLRRVQEP